MKKISQRDARYYRKQTAELQGILDRQGSRWQEGWRPGWVNIETLTLSDASFAKIEVARKLGHAVIVVPGGKGNEIMFYAEKL